MTNTPEAKNFTLQALFWAVAGAAPLLMLHFYASHALKQETAALPKLDPQATVTLDKAYCDGNAGRTIAITYQGKRGALTCP